MDDLAGLDWSQPTKNKPNPPAAFPPFRQSPTPQLSGRSTPLSAPPTQPISSRVSPNNLTPFNAPSKPATPANDSFAGLVATNKPKASAAGLSLQERQKQLELDKQREEEEGRRQFDFSFAKADSSHWNTVGGSQNTIPPSVALGVPPSNTNPFSNPGLSKTIEKSSVDLYTASQHPVQSPSEEDLLAAFNSAAPVDKSSHFPVPVPSSGKATPTYHQNVSRHQTPLSQTHNTALDDDDDDDMFGLKQMAPTPEPPPPASHANHVDEDDILGLLSKPVSDFQNKEEPAPTSQSLESHKDSHNPQTAHDQAVAELVDMGFPVEKSAIALATTESGLDVQAAVSWLLNQAHADTKKKKTQNPDLEARRGGMQPAWMREEEGKRQSGQRRQDGPSQEKDVSQMASEIGNTLFKSANSLWKTGRKQVQKAMADLNQEGDPTMPKWMRDAQVAEAAPRLSKAAKAGQAATDEAMMLDASVRPSKSTRTRNLRHDDLSALPRRDKDAAGKSTPDRMQSQSPAQRQQPVSLEKRPATRLTRHEAEEKSAHAYTSPARRKKTTPQPHVDLFAPEPEPARPPPPQQPPPFQSRNPFLQTPNALPVESPVSLPIPTRPKVPPRHIPPVTASALSSSAANREQGSLAFKRGDYAAAHAAYSSALSPLPQSHPVTIVVLCNRAVTNIKVGDPKAAIADADSALAVIGASRGEGESIPMGGTEGDKNMKEFYAKALMRKAEALENMEKWPEAYQVWKEAVQNGVGGAISISGRNRCAKAGSGGPVAAATLPKRSTPVRRPVPKPSTTLSDLGGPVKDSEAVKRMKAANAAADRAEDEKFALTDQVDSRLTAWKGTKADNLRALLGSLETVLWEDAGWKKVNMGDLVMPNKVKIIYMKAIAKVHPDKISQAATTEQRMISAAVFATLNEAWDKFKSDNDL